MPIAPANRVAYGSAGYLFFFPSTPVAAPIPGPAAHPIEHRDSGFQFPGAVPGQTELPAGGGTRNFFQFQNPIFPNHALLAERLS